MPRPQKCRKICSEPEYISFFPDGYPANEVIYLSVDEYEVIRLVDLEKLTHEQTARQMEISRTTVTEIYESARGKIADSIVNGKQMVITGGNYFICKGKHKECSNRNCMHKCVSQATPKSIVKKGSKIMRIAVTYENGEIFQHFGHSEAFKIYDVEDNKVVSSQVVGTNGSGHGALAGMLKELNVNALICGGIGGGAQNALNEAGIKLYGGVSGNADEAVEALLNGSLSFNPNIKCSHHGGHHHGEGHKCGDHGCGNHGCH